MAEGSGRPPGRPVEFDHAKVVRVAQQIVERGGLDALTLRDLAKKSGTTTASIHRNIGSRDAVLGAVLDAYGAMVPLPELPDEPRARLVALFAHIYDAHLTYSWVLDVLVRTREFPASAMAWVELFFEATDALGIDKAESVRLYRRLWAYTLGALLTHADDDSPADRPSAVKEKLDRVIRQEGYPRVTRFVARGPGLTREDYLEGLESQLLLVGGVE